MIISPKEVRTRRIAAFGLAAAAFAAVTVTVTVTAGAANAASSADTTTPSHLLGAVAAATPGASTASAIKIKSYVETDKVRLTGTGRNAGWSYKDDFTVKNILTPKLSEESTGHWSNTYKSQSARWHFILVNGVGHRSDNGGAWKTYPKLTAKQLASDQYYANPMHIPPLMFKLKVARRIVKGHWRATGTLAQLAPFINNELNLSTADFKQHGYKKLTINLWLDSKGRPTKVTATGTARYEKASLTETFTNYGKPLTIVAPKA
jgi:hypothetical protein